jgi:hypothetical protein
MAGVDIIENLNFVIEKKWTSVYPLNNDKRALLNEFKGQLMRYGTDEKGKITGKYGGKFKDDLTIAFLMAVYWSRVLEQPQKLNPYFQFLDAIEKHQKLIKSNNLTIKPFYDFNVKQSLLPDENKKDDKKDQEDDGSEYAKRFKKSKKRSHDQISNSENDSDDDDDF